LVRFKNKFNGVAVLESSSTEIDGRIELEQIFNKPTIKEKIKERKKREKNEKRERKEKKETKRVRKEKKKIRKEREANGREINQIRRFKIKN